MLPLPSQRPRKDAPLARKPKPPEKNPPVAIPVPAAPELEVSYASEKRSLGLRLGADALRTVTNPSARFNQMLRLMVVLVLALALTAAIVYMGKIALAALGKIP